MPENSMHRFGIEEETWFEAARTGLEQRGFRMRVQARSIVIEKEGRLPRIVGGAREFLEYAERQGLKIDPGAWEVADRYGDARSDFTGRVTPSPFETPPVKLAPPPAWGAPAPAAAASLGVVKPEVQALEARLAELRREQEKLAQEKREAGTWALEKRQWEERCSVLEVDKARAVTEAARAASETARVQGMLEDAMRQCEIWRQAAVAAEDRLAKLQQEAEGAAAAKAGGPDKRFDQLRRYLARELHPDLAGDDIVQRELREALFKRVWAKVEQLQ